MLAQTEFVFADGESGITESMRKKREEKKNKKSFGKKLADFFTNANDTDGKNAFSINDLSGLIDIG